VEQFLLSQKKNRRAMRLLAQVADDEAPEHERNAQQPIDLTSSAPIIMTAIAPQTIIGNDSGFMTGPWC
jgi:hypothetical protein